jgi:acyl carrier protein
LKAKKKGEKAVEMIQTIKQFIVDNFLFEEDNEFGEKTSFLEEGIIDSTGILELVTFIEETYDIEVEDEELIPDNLDSLSKVVRFIQGKREGLNLTIDPISLYEPRAACVG